MTKNNWDTKVFISVYNLQSITKASWDRNSRHGLGSRNWNGSHGGMCQRQQLEKLSNYIDQKVNVCFWRSQERFLLNTMQTLWEWTRTSRKKVVYEQRDWNHLLPGRTQNITIKRANKLMETLRRSGIFTMGGKRKNEKVLLLKGNIKHSFKMIPRNKFH